MSRKIRAVLVVLGLLVVLAFASCADTGRPNLDDWAADWEGVTGAVPTLVQLGDPPDRDLCGHTLGRIREGRVDLFPAPDLALDPVVTEWFTIAEDAMFECPPSSSQLPSLEFAYRELARLEAEVDTVLMMSGEGG